MESSIENQEWPPAKRRRGDVLCNVPDKNHYLCWGNKWKRNRSTPYCNWGCSDETECKVATCSFGGPEAVWIETIYPKLRYDCAMECSMETALKQSVPVQLTDILTCIFPGTQGVRTLIVAFLPYQMSVGDLRN